MILNGFCDVPTRQCAFLVQCDRVLIRKSFCVGLYPELIIIGASMGELMIERMDGEMDGCAHPEMDR